MRKANYLNESEKEVWCSYKKMGCSNLTRCKVNQINLAVNETKEHNLKMIEICAQLILKDEKFITEAVPLKCSNRRVDIINLSNGNKIEIELNKNRIKPDADITYLYDKGNWILI